MDTRLTLIVIAASLSACAHEPAQSVRDKLDLTSGTTVSVVSLPVELLTNRFRGGHADPFAYLAPFETDTMGTRAVFLWVSEPRQLGSVAPPVLSCDGQSMDLTPRTGELSEIGLSHPPYPSPEPWGRQWYYPLPLATLKCLANAHSISIEIPATDGDPERFTAEAAKGGNGFPVLQEFLARRAD